MTRTILLLGGSAQQVVAINTAKKLGYTTVLCDYLPDNPGRQFADVFYLTSTTDKEAVLEVAKKEKINGVVAYASDPAAPTAAYVSEELGLPGIPYEIAKAFCEKNLFRKFLKENGFHAPKSVVARAGEQFKSEFIEGLRFPIIVKPSDASGSKGVTVVDNLSDIDAALKEASKYSRNGNLVMEEFIQRDHKHVIEAELFIQNGEVVVWGLINSIRDKKTNPLVPAAYSFPLAVSQERIALVKQEISQLIHAAKIKNGAMNIELIIDDRNNLYFLDVGPRNGGNMLPDFISKIFDIDIVEATLRVAMNDICCIESGSMSDLSLGYWGLGVLHSEKSGAFKAIKYSREALEALLVDYVQTDPGEPVNTFTKCTDLVGLAFFKFNNEALMDDVMENFAKHAYVELDGEIHE